ncbi:transcriptional regulator, TetR family [Methylocella silvestris BL2]|uniref:Transcriptional regulator, TetR family n=1 Tax=Methylocella silvestris (strain DSM 15510 / CIP 108128 / LMG 27833 / NCIMB 13906 / BL2) TaxID=395965 RepID=B8EJD5_METSB|nr:TetR/AcrR family transcriptional regulator [Methylocella silvestris]ACK52627.1 transcriptional regulator, TetR family [Methylocella silvestris BL2]
MTHSASIDARRTQNGTRDAIIDVALTLFGRVGFQKTTIKDIARQLRMSPANIYRFFGTKAELNDAVGRRLLNEMEASVIAIAKRRASASDRLRACITAIEESNARRFLFDPALHELIEIAFDESWPSAADHVQTIEKTLSGIISQGAHTGEFRVNDSDLAAILVHNACVRFPHPRLIEERRRKTTPTLDQMMDFCLAAITD